MSTRQSSSRARRTMPRGNSPGIREPLSPARRTERSAGECGESTPPAGARWWRSIGAKTGLSIVGPPWGNLGNTLPNHINGRG